MRALASWLLLPWIALFVLSAVMIQVSEAQDKSKKPEISCQDQLTMMTALAKEYDQTRDNAIREKVAYKNAYEAQVKNIQALEKQLADLKPKSEEKKAE